MKTIIGLTLGLLMMTGCSTYQYDAKNPEKYIEFWCDPSNDNLLTDLSDHQNKSRAQRYAEPQYQTNISQRQRCIEQSIPNDITSKQSEG